MGKTEAILFAGGEPVSLDRIAQVLGVRTPVIDSIVSALQEKYNTPASGIQLMRLGDSAQFCTNPAYVEPVREVLDLKRGTPLSQAAMEVLAVVAYNQPVTKAFVEQVRGVDCSGVLSSLMQKDLLEERGRLELPGLCSPAPPRRFCAASSSPPSRICPRRPSAARKASPRRKAS